MTETSLAFARFWRASTPGGAIWCFLTSMKRVALLLALAGGGFAAGFGLMLAVYRLLLRGSVHSNG